MATGSITESDLLEALASAQRANPDGQTASEMAATTGITYRKVLAALKAFQAAGRLRVQYGRRLGIDGREKPVPLYTILAKRGK